MDSATSTAQMLQQSIETQLKASDELLSAVRELAEAARDTSNASITPTIAPQLEKLIKVASDLNVSANSAAQTLKILAPS